MNSIEDRALAAYFRYPSKAGEILQQPSRPLVVKHEGKEYVVLSSVRGTLAVYRVKPDGFLKRLDRWPKEVAPK